MSARIHTGLPSLREQAERLIALGVELEELSHTYLRAMASKGQGTGGLLVVHPEHAPASTLASALEHNGKRGFVVVDMLDDLDAFSPIEQATLPSESVYVVQGLERGDQMANWSPDEALNTIVVADRTPLTLSEGIHWLLQRPDVLERGRCFMTIGSRRRKASGALDPRTPALWISNGTGRDGRENRDAPKVGWCWAGNRHTWLGFASAAGRVSL